MSRNADWAVYPPATFPGAVFAHGTQELLQQLRLDCLAIQVINSSNPSHGCALRERSDFHDRAIFPEACGSGVNHFALVLDPRVTFERELGHTDTELHRDTSLFHEV